MPNDNNEIAIVEGPLPQGYGDVNTSLAVSLARAEVDQQIATARAMPRILSRVVQNIQTLATLDEDTAEECVYALPRGGKPIKGPSIRLAEIIGTQWGNARVGARVVHVDRTEMFVEAEGVFHDLETNMATTARVRRRISDKKGKLLTDDMIIVTGNAACAIAKRNAILGAVPKAVWRKAYDAVEKVIAGDVKTLAERREKAMKAFAAFGATPEQVLAALGVSGLDDITLEHMPLLAGMHSSLKSGEATVEEMFLRQSADRSGPGIAGVQQRLNERKSTAPIDMNQHVERELAPVNHDPDTGEVTEIRNGNAPSVADDPAAAHSPSEKTAAGSPLSWREQGRAAYHGGANATDCPTDATKEQQSEWLAGFDEAAGDDFPGDKK
jgi:hypothetical protein